jgi:ABC-type transport system substrate-binding protein
MRVRKALNYAVNKEEMMRYAFKGNAVKMRGILTEKTGVDLSDTEAYEWNIPKARELLKEAGYDQGFKMTLFYLEKDYLTAQFLQRFYSLLKIEVEIAPKQWEWFVRHMVYPNTRDGYSWEDEDWWLVCGSHPALTPEMMPDRLRGMSHSNAPFRITPKWITDPIDRWYHEILRSKEREKRFELYKRTNEYIADQALWVFTLAPLSLYGVNQEFDFKPQLSQYLFLEHSSVTDRHWSVKNQD